MGPAEVLVDVTYERRLGNSDVVTTLIAAALAALVASSIFFCGFIHMYALIAKPQRQPEKTEKEAPVSASAQVPQKQVSGPRQSTVQFKPVEEIVLAPIDSRNFTIPGDFSEWAESLSQGGPQFLMAGQKKKIAMVTC